MEKGILEKLKNRDSLDNLSKEVVNSWGNFDAEFKLNFLFTLRRENMRDFADSISRILSMEQNERIQATMVKIFHQLGVDTTGTFFLQCIHSIDPRVRANALEAIGNKYTEKYEDVVFAFLDDMDNRVRANAIKILWASGDLKV
ncbi:HEAT repeat domain-containing protein, partial [bacterium]|nr:HEAT repeat domain-containing protein [bacterium]